MPPNVWKHPTYNATTAFQLGGTTFATPSALQAGAVSNTVQGRLNFEDGLELGGEVGLSGPQSFRATFFNLNDPGDQSRWLQVRVDSNRRLAPVGDGDGLWDLGISVARWRDGWFSRDVRVGNRLLVGTDSAGDAGTGGLRALGDSQIDGDLRLGSPSAAFRIIGRRDLGAGPNVTGVELSTLVDGTDRVRIRIRRNYVEFWNHNGAQIAQMNAQGDLAIAGSLSQNASF